ncbi:cell division protein FtsL [Ligilactobacillus acidipiscis]|jgi:cell division protein FtsL|uniref:cell division protein FtsL n=1 Tax=Ligilactobacillus acidipiscis TaxID=89059 RepID=UPI0029FDA400|nr:cell division protein FtsL [Ligilactobacillus acidipiscis]MCI1954011.1 cell division protein FtsL [Ligilactobacillus acidipiscis]
MAQNTARQIMADPVSQPVHTKKNKSEQQSKKAFYLKIEKIMVVLISAWVSVLACFVVASAISLNSSQVDLQKVSSQISAIQSKNANTKQEVGELTSRSRLDAFAKRAGLSMNEQNTRNVSK